LPESSLTELGTGCVLIRKKNKGNYPIETESITYDLEYGPDTIENHIDANKKDGMWVELNDLLATGGTALAGSKFSIKKVGGKLLRSVSLLTAGIRVAEKA